MFGNFLSKAKELKKVISELKNRLDTIYVKEYSANGKVMVIASASKKIIEIKIDEELKNRATKAELENYILLASNKALEKSEEIAKEEMKKSTKGLLPNIPGLW